MYSASSKAKLEAVATVAASLLLAAAPPAAERGPPSLAFAQAAAGAFGPWRLLKNSRAKTPAIRMLAATVRP